MNIQDWLRERVEFGVGFIYASQLEKSYRRETGEWCNTYVFFQELLAVAKEHGIEDRHGGFPCRVKMPEPLESVNQ